MLYTLSAWGQASWERYVSAFDALFVASGLDAASADQELRLRRWRALAVLGALGHVERGADNGTAVLSAPSVFARLPCPGLPKAVLCGSRGPQTLADLRAAARSFRGVSVRCDAQRSRNPYAPRRIEISAAGGDHLREISERVGLSYLPAPAAWTIADTVGSVSDYLSQLPWRSVAELDWPRTDFAPAALRFVSATETRSALRLTRYKNPTTGTLTSWLRRGDEAVEVDPYWGRYAVLHERHHQVVRYDHRRFELHEPWGAPLPPVLARVLTLCTGEVATEVPPAGAEWGYYLYAGVPPDVAEAVLEKIGQEST